MPINSVICNDQNDPIFVYYLLKTKEEVFRRSAASTAVPILNKSAFSSIPILGHLLKNNVRSRQWQVAMTLQLKIC